MTEVRVPPSGPFETIEGGAGAPLSHVLYVDAGTAVAPADQTGSQGSPFSTLAAALLAAAVVPEVNFARYCTLAIVPGDYTAEGEQELPPVILLFQAMGPGVLLPAFATPDPLEAIGATAFSGCQFAGFTAAQGLSETQWSLDLLNGSRCSGNIVMFGDLTVHGFGESQPSQLGPGLNFINGDIECRVFTATDLFLGALAATITTAGVEWQNTRFSNDGRTITSSAGMAVDLFTLNNLFSTGATFPIASNIAPCIATAPIAVAVPALLAGELSYVDVDLTGSRLDGIQPNEPIGFAPVEDVEAAGVDQGTPIGVRVSAANTARLSFVGVTSAHSVDFVFWRP